MTPLAAVLLLPWGDPDDVPLPGWARSVVPHRPETVLVASPHATDARRATTLGGARLPLYGAVRGPGCGGRWLHVGLATWLCSDEAELSADSPDDARPRADLPYSYWFVGKQGANGYANLLRAGDEAPDEELDAGFAIATTEERFERGQRWVHTRHATWVAASALGAAHPSGFHGEEVGPAGLDFAWVGRPRLHVYATDALSGKPVRELAWREVVTVRERKGAVVRIGDAAWVDAHALLVPALSVPPPGAQDETWIDVDLATQVLVAYVGPTPVFATLVSTGLPGPATATHKGTFRIWVKLVSSTMDNIEPDSGDAHPAFEGARYSIEDVPYVQFFDKAIALHGAFWHDDFGRPRSHGCVNLAPHDAARLFEMTSPRLTAGLSAVLPADIERGSWVRVH